MAIFDLLQLAVLWLSTLGAGAVASTSSGSDGPGTETLQADATVELCLDEESRGGEGRPVLVVTAYGGEGSLTVTADDGATTRIGLFPGGPFQAETPDGAQRFFLPGAPGVRCWEVSFTGEQGGGRATLSLGREAVAE